MTGTKVRTTANLSWPNQGSFTIATTPNYLDPKTQPQDLSSVNPHKLARTSRIVFFNFLLLSLLLHAATAHAQLLNETIFHAFTNSADGSNPSGGVIVGQDGSLYGTASNGGTNNGYGTLFQINRNGSGYHVLRNFEFFSGAYPGSLVQGTNGFLYGTTGQGGSNFGGTVFTISTNGTGYAQLHAFLQTGSGGEYPNPGLVLASNGVLYGTSGGGISNVGTAFRLNSDGSDFQTLHQFTNSPDGSYPSSMILGADGILYGATSSGGSTNGGTIFKMNTNGNNYVILHSFTNSPDGEEPLASLIQGKDGMLYGTTVFGGSVISIGGTLFKIDTNGGNYTILHSFPFIVADGANPQSIIQAPDGFLYGVAQNNGAFGNGMVFKSDTTGTNFVVAYSFSNSPPDGANPSAPLFQSADGAFYGTANNGGLGQGIVFRLTPPLKLSYQSSSSHGTNTSILSWPAWASDYGIRTSPTLNSNATWTPLSAVTIGTKLFTTNKSTAPNAFFRLQTPP